MHNIPNPLQVLIVAQDARSTGGVNNYLRILRRQLRLRGDIAAVRFASGRRHKETGLLRMILRIARDQIRFAALLARRRFDVVHLNPSFDLTSLPRELVYAFISRIVSPSTSVLLYYRGWHWSALEKFRSNPILRRGLSYAHARVDMILVLSARFRDALMAMGVPASKILVTTTFFDGDVLSPVLNRHSRRPRQLLFLGRFIPDKRCDVLIAAFGLLSGRFPDAELVMAGDGPERPSLEACARELGLEHRIRFTGYLHGAAKWAALAQSAVFVLPSQREGLPNALLEAMAAGLAVVTTDVGGIGEIMQDGHGGRVLKSVDAQGLADALTPYLADDEFAIEQGRINGERAWKTWDARVVTALMADLYRSLATTPNRSTAGAPLEAKRV